MTATDATGRPLGEVTLARGSAKPPSAEYDVALLDLDGVVYVGPHAVPGVPAALDEVINSSYVLARYLAREAPGARCFVIGEAPLVEELRAVGLAPVDDARVDYVVVAFDRTFDYRKLDVALQAVQRHGARLVGTNPDRTCPVEGGEIPDAAGMIGAVEGVTGRRVEPATSPAVRASTAGSDHGRSSAGRTVAIRREKTSPSSRELDASRLAPCTPEQAASPVA